MSTLLTRRPLLTSLLDDDDPFRLPDGILDVDRFLAPSRLFNKDLLRGTLPAVNIKDDHKSFVLELAVPGYRKEDLKVNVKENVLTISSEKKHENEEQKKGSSRREFSYSSFTRSFLLPDNVDAENIKARYEDGLLKLSIAKTRELPENKGKEIKIN